MHRRTRRLRRDARRGPIPVRRHGDGAMRESLRLTETGRLIVAAATVLAILGGLLLLYIDGKWLEPKGKTTKSKAKAF